MGKTGLNSDATLVAGPGNVANGHCDVPALAGRGHCIFGGGTGTFVGFHATLDVTKDPSVVHGWYWDGPYHFDP